MLFRSPSDSSKDYYYVIRNTPNNETLIVEYGFLDNARDAAKLKANYKDYAEAVVRAVAEYGGYKYVVLQRYLIMHDKKVISQPVCYPYKKHGECTQIQVDPYVAPA